MPGWKVLVGSVSVVRWGRRTASDEDVQAFLYSEADVQLDEPEAQWEDLIAIASAKEVADSPLGEGVLADCVSGGLVDQCGGRGTDQANSFISICWHIRLRLCGSCRVRSRP